MKLADFEFSSETKPNLEKRLALTQCPRGPHVMYQDWEHLLFAHWEWDPEEIQKTLPPGLTVDTFEEKAYLGLVPFYMNKIRPRFFPAIPGLSWFLEMNLRTYVYDEQGRAGVWFYSLDCNQPLAVMVARKSYRLPYEHATMRAELQDSWVNYHSTRQATGDHTHIRYRGVSEIQTAFPGSLEFFFSRTLCSFCLSSKQTLHRTRVSHSLPFTKS